MTDLQKRRGRPPKNRSEDPPPSSPEAPAEGMHDTLDRLRGQVFDPSLSLPARKAAYVESLALLDRICLRSPKESAMMTEQFLQGAKLRLAAMEQTPEQEEFVRWFRDTTKRIEG